MSNGSKRLVGGFLGLVVGLAIVLVGVFLGGNLVVIAAGGVVGLAGLSGFVLDAFALESEGGSPHESDPSAANQHSH